MAGIVDAAKLLKASAEGTKEGVSEALAQDRKIRMSDMAADRLGLKEKAKETRDQVSGLFNTKNLSILSAAMAFKGPRQIMSKGMGILGSLGKIGMIGGGIAAGVGILSNVNIDSIQKFTSNMGDVVESLLGIMDRFGGVATFFAKGGVFGATMFAIGRGLSEFAKGAAMSGVAVTALDLFTNATSQKNWAVSVVDNVNTLINGFAGFSGPLKSMENLVKGGALSITLQAIGKGLASFGMGAAIGGGVNEVLNIFSGNGWASNVVRDVGTLIGMFSGEDFTFTDGDGNKRTIGGDWLSAGGSMLKAGAFQLTMEMIGKGLAGFGIGAAIGGGANEILNLFSGNGWAENIVRDVGTLVNGISDVIWNTKEGVFPTKGFDSNVASGMFRAGGFIGTMASIGAGLSAFGVGAAIGGSVNEVLNRFSGGNFAQSIVDSVKTLMKVGDDPDTNLANAKTFKETMGNLAGGLLMFGAANLGESAASLAANVMNIFSGGSSIDRILKVVNNLEYDALNSVSMGLHKLAESLIMFGKVGNIKFKGFDTKNLKKDMERLETILFGNKKIIGFANYGMEYEMALDNMRRLQETVSINPSIQGVETAQRAPQGVSGAQVNLINNTNNNITANSGNTNVASNRSTQVLGNVSTKDTMGIPYQPSF